MAAKDQNSGAIVYIGIVIGVLAGVAAMVGVTLFLVSRYRRKRHQLDKGTNIVIKNMQPTIPRTTVAVPAQTSCMPERRQEEMYNGPDSKDPLLGVLRRNFPERSYSDWDIMTSVAKSVRDEMKPKLSISSMDIINIVDVEAPSPGPKESAIQVPMVNCFLVWTSSSRCLTISVSRIENLPPKYQRNPLSLAVTLRIPAIFRNVASTPVIKSLKKKLHSDYSQVFCFQDIDLEEAQGSDISIEISSRRKSYLPSRTVGDLEYSLGHAYLLPDMPATLHLPLNLHKAISSVPSTPPPFKAEEMELFEKIPEKEVKGYLCLILQHQITGYRMGRIKIVVRKAANLISRRSGGEFKVDVLIKCGETTEAVYSTKCVHGLSPVWNTPFIFDVKLDKILEYSVETTVIRIGRTKSYTTIGMSTISSNASPSGAKHWNDIISSPGKEITMWHVIH